MMMKQHLRQPKYLIMKHGIFIRTASLLLWMGSGLQRNNFCEPRWRWMQTIIRHGSGWRE
jgi:hypothetical protein